MKKQNAYVLIFTLTILSLVTILTHQLLRTVYVGTHFDRAMINREHAEMLALGGINLAVSQLIQEKPLTKLSDENLPDNEKQKKLLANFLNRVLPHLNRWQTFVLNKEIDGIDGKIKICISCEEGKININEAFDWEKKEFKPVYQTFLASLQFKGKNKSIGQFLKKLTKFLKQRNKKIDDLSQLQTEALGNITQLFYEPPIRTKKKKEAKSNEIIAIQDLFTIWSKSDKLEALFLSDALCSILNLRRPRAYDAQLRKEKFKDVIKNFDPNKEQNNDEYWKMMQPLYDQKSTFKIDDKKIFSSKFEPKVYSVLSSGKVGDVEQKLLAIIEMQQITEKNDDQKKQEPTKKEEQSKQEKSFKIQRLYWI